MNKKKQRTLFVIIVIIAVLIIAAAVGVMYWKKLGPFAPGRNSPDIAQGEEKDIKNAALSVHFLELGNYYTGDCTLIKCGDTEVLIDAGSRKDSAKTLKNYIDKYCTDGVLEYVIATHAHQDHISGFVGSKDKATRTGVFYQYKIENLIQFSLTDATTVIYGEYKEAVEYLKTTGTNVYTAAQCYNETDGAKRSYYLDEEQTVSMNILYNYFYYNDADTYNKGLPKGAEKANENDYSVCMMLSQAVGTETLNYLFTGDLEYNGEKKLAEYYENSDKDFKGGLPEVELFKGGHHGSYTASNDVILRMIKPKNVAVCCCCGTTEYGAKKGNEFPAQDFIDRISKYTENVYCTTLVTDNENRLFTSMNGNIVFYYDTKLKLYCSDNSLKLKDTEWFKANRVWN